MGTKNIFCFSLIWILLGGLLVTPPIKAELKTQPLLGAPIKSSSGASFKLGVADATTDFVPSNIGIIGIKYLHKPGETSTVIDLYPNTPAEASGIKVGDRILEVDGVNIVPLSSDQVFSLIAGRPDTMVNLKMMHCPNGFGSYGCVPYTIDLKRMDMNEIASDKVFHIYKYGSMY